MGGARRPYEGEIPGVSPGMGSCTRTEVGAGQRRGEKGTWGSELGGSPSGPSESRTARHVLVNGERLTLILRHTSDPLSGHPLSRLRAFHAPQNTCLHGLCSRKEGSQEMVRKRQERKEGRRRGRCWWESRSNRAGTEGDREETAGGSGGKAPRVTGPEARDGGRHCQPAPRATRPGSSLAAWEAPLPEVLGHTSRG